jgi:hypothetical protein
MVIGQRLHEYIPYNDHVVRVASTKSPNNNNNNSVAINFFQRVVLLLPSDYFVVSRVPHFQNGARERKEIDGGGGAVVPKS